jgi:hypothetical protein
VRKSGALRIGIVLLLATAAAGVFALVGRADDPLFDNPSSSLQPGFIDAGKTVLYHTQWHDNDNRTFTHAQVEVFVPAGWTLESSAPGGCTQANAGATVICPKGTLRFGQVVSQDVRLTSNSVIGTATVDSQLTFYEGPGNPGRVNHVPSDVYPVGRQVEVIDPAANPNKAGDCAAAGGHVSTDAGVGESDTDATAPSTGKLCTPITIDEPPRTDPTQFCLDDQCVTDLVKTDAPVGDPTKPIKLKIVFRGTGLNNRDLIFSSAGNSSPVGPCANQNVASPDPCWYDRRARQQSVTWYVNWSGVDPIWDS